MLRYMLVLLYAITCCVASENTIETDTTLLINGKRIDR